METVKSETVLKIKRARGDHLQESVRTCTYASRCSLCGDKIASKGSASAILHHVEQPFAALLPIVTGEDVRANFNEAR
jgi:hypothetical protein